MTSSHTLSSITPKAATGNGDLDGYTGACSCGAKFTTSLSEREAQRLVLDHIAWAVRKGR